MMTKEQIAEAAEQYAEQENSAWTNDYNGFEAGANFVLQNLQQTACYVQLTPLLNHYDAWIKETKRNGGVLVGSSIKELLQYLDAKTNEELHRALIAS